MVTVPKYKLERTASSKSMNSGTEQECQKLPDFRHVDTPKNHSVPWLHGDALTGMMTVRCGRAQEECSHFRGTGELKGGARLSCPEPSLRTLKEIKATQTAIKSPKNRYRRSRKVLRQQKDAKSKWAALRKQTNKKGKAILEVNAIYWNYWNSDETPEEQCGEYLGGDHIKWHGKEKRGTSDYRKCNRYERQIKNIQRMHN